MGSLKLTEHQNSNDLGAESLESEDDSDSSSRSSTIASFINPGIEPQKDPALTTQEAQPESSLKTSPKQPKLHVTSRTLVCSEKHSDTSGRLVRVVQKELCIVGGDRLRTRIEVCDTLLPGSPVVFSVKHTHDSLWDRQKVVHRNVLFACALAEVASPPVAIPRESRVIFESLDSLPYINSYMERILPHIRLPCGNATGVRLYWWRAVQYGAGILQHEGTGRVIAFPNRKRQLSGAAACLARALTLLREITWRLTCTASDATEGNTTTTSPASWTSFLDVHPEYPVDIADVPDWKDEDGSAKAMPSQVLSLSEIKACVQTWAVKNEVSPWKTTRVIRQQGLRKNQVTYIRYSLDLDVLQRSALSIQVHSNQPLSRVLQAFPVCMVPMPIHGPTTLRAVYTRFQQTLWFLQKLYDFHQDLISTSSEKPLSTQPRWGSVSKRHDTLAFQRQKQSPSCSLALSAMTAQATPASRTPLWTTRYASVPPSHRTSLSDESTLPAFSKRAEQHETTPSSNADNASVLHTLSIAPTTRFSKQRAACRGAETSESTTPPKHVQQASCDRVTSAPGTPTTPGNQPSPSSDDALSTTSPPPYQSSQEPFEVVLDGQRGAQQRADASRMCQGPQRVETV